MTFLFGLLLFFCTESRSQDFDLTQYDSLLTKIAELPSIDSCITLALENSTELKDNRYEASSQRVAIKNNRTNWLDNINFVASAGYGNNFFDFNNNNVLISSSQAAPNFSISLNYRFSPLLAKQARFKTVSDNNNLKRLENKVEEIKRTLIENVSRLYYEVKINAKDLQFLLLNLESYFSSFRVVTQKFNQGDIEYAALITEKQSLLTIQSRAETLAIRIEQQLFFLKNIIGLIQY